MKNWLKKGLNLAIICTTTLLASSCLDNDFEERQIEERAAINKFIEGKGYTDFDGQFYIKIENKQSVTIPEDGIKFGEAFYISYNITDLDGEILESTSEVEGKKIYPERHWIYGPSRIRSGEISIYGFDTAVKYFSKGDTGSIVLPSWNAWSDGVPKVFNVCIKEIINVGMDAVVDSTWLEQFLSLSQWDKSKKINTIPAYYNTPNNPEYKLPDALIHPTTSTIAYTMVARYIEPFSNNKMLGRVFYPIQPHDSVSQIREFKEPLEFPNLAIIDSVLLRMEKGDELELATTSTYGWGEKGYYHPVQNTVIVPQYAPVYFKIKVDSIYVEEEPQ